MMGKAGDKQAALTTDTAPQKAATGAALGDQTSMPQATCPLKSRLSLTACPPASVSDREADISGWSVGDTVKVCFCDTFRDAPANRVSS